MMTNSKKILLQVHDYICIIFGMFLYALGYTAFVLPEKIVIGGLPGISSILYYQFGLPTGPVNYGFNLILLAIAYKAVGRQFVLRTLFGAGVLSLFITFLQPLFSEPLVAEQSFMNAIIGALLCGFGMGISFVHNGSSGGSDIVAAMAAKYTNVSIGRTILYVDCVIISSSFLLFHNVENVVFGFIFLLILTFSTDFVINSNRKAVQFTIYSPKWKEIADTIIQKAHRGCTVMNGIGWYTQKEVKMVVVSCRKIEAVTMFRIIKSVDPNAFITQTAVNGVYGRGFDNMKVSLKKDIDSDVRHVHPQTFYGNEADSQHKNLEK